MGSIDVRFKAQLDELITGMQSAGSVTTEAAEQMRNELRLVNSEARESGNGLEGFVDHVRGMRREAFLGNFMARQIADVGIASKGAAGAVTGLVSSFAIGGGIGLAIEGVKLLVEALHSVGEEAEKQAEAVNAAFKSSFKAATDAMERVKESLDPKSRTQTAWEEQARRTREEVAKLQEKIDAIVKNSGGVRDLFHELTTTAKGASDAFTVKSTSELIAPLQAQQQALLAGLEAAKPAKAGAKDAEEAADREQENRVAEKEKEAHELKMMQLHAQGLEGEEKLDAEYAVKLQQIEDSKSLSVGQKEQQVAAESQLYIKQVVDYRQQQEDKAEQQHTKYLNQLIKAEYQAAEALKKYFADKEAERVKQWEASEKKVADGMRAMTANAEKFGNAFGSVFEGMITHTKTLGQAFVAMAQQIVREVVSMAIIQIKANAGVAGAEAAASVASTPFAGPFMAIAAMTAVEGAVLGLLSLVSAEGGYDIPTGVNPIVQAHAGEMILPRQYADVIRGMAGGTGGSQMHLHFPNALFVDRRGLEQLAQDPNFVSGFMEARRNGRLP